MNKLHPLRLYLLTNGIKQNDFAKQLGITPSFLSLMLSYKYFPSRKTAMKINELTNNEITINDLFCPENQVKL